MPRTVVYHSADVKHEASKMVDNLPPRGAILRGMGTSTDLEPDLAAYLAHWLREQVKAGRSMRSLAAALNITHATVSDVLSAKSNAGSKLLNAISEAEDLSPKEIKARALAWAKANPPPDTVVVRESRYPNLERAIEFALHSGKPPSEGAIASVRSMALKSPNDQTTEEWFEDLRAEERRMARDAGPSLPSRDMPAPEKRAPLSERIAKVKAKKAQ